MIEETRHEEIHGVSRKGSAPDTRSDGNCRGSGVGRHSLRSFRESGCSRVPFPRYPRLPARRTSDRFDQVLRRCGFRFLAFPDSLLPKRRAATRLPTPVSWIPGFRVGDMVRTVGASGSYSRGEVVEAAREGRYYRVDYGRGFPTLIREENLAPFDEGNPLSRPPRSFVPPVPPFFA